MPVGMALRAVPKMKESLGRLGNASLPRLNGRSSCPSHRDKLRRVVNAFSFSLLMNRLRHFLVESIALPCFRQPLVFGLDISLALFRNLLDLFLQTISLCARFADASFQIGRAHV